MYKLKILTFSLLSLSLICSVNYASGTKKVKFRPYASVVAQGKKVKHVKLKKEITKKNKTARRIKQVKSKKIKKAPVKIKKQAAKKRTQAKAQRKSQAKKVARQKIKKAAPAQARGKKTVTTKKAPVVRKARKRFAQEFEVTTRHGAIIKVIEGGDIIKQPGVEAIVNAANETLIGAAGIALAIQQAAGPQLIKYIKKLPLHHGVRCKTGHVVITPGFNLPNPWIIHAVGPTGSNPDRNSLLQDVYEDIFGIAFQNNISSVAIPAISTGIFGFPEKEAAQIAVTTTINSLNTFATNIKEVRFIVWGQENFNYYKQFLSTVV